MKFILLIFTFFLFQSLYNCKREFSPVSPKENNPANYKWTVDTLYIPDHDYVHISSIWGSSSNDIYAGGICHSTSGPSLTAMWHYNGKSWQRLKLHLNEGGNIHLGAYMDITGFSASNVYVVGGHSIVHFNGKDWNETSLDSDSDLYSIWANSPDDIWTGGYNGTLYHFDGSNWTFYQAPDSVHIRSISGFDSDEVYAIASKSIDGYRWSYFLQWNGYKWSIKEKFNRILEDEHFFGIYDLFAVDSIMFSVGEGLWRRSRNDTLWNPDFYSYTDYLCVYGISSDNLWLGGASGSFAHYPNFKDALWINYFRHLTTHFRDIWTDGKEVFALGTTLLNKKSYIIHGK